MMYVFGWLLIAGGVVVVFILGPLLGAAFGGSMVALGILLAALGAVVEAVKDLGRTVASESEKTREVLRNGFDFVTKRLDHQIEAAAASVETVTPIPLVGTAAHDPKA